MLASDNNLVDSNAQPIPMFQNSRISTYFNDIVKITGVQTAIEEGNLQKFLEYQLTKDDLLNIKLKHNLNVLQAVSYFGAERILKYLTKIFIDDDAGR